MEPIPNGFSRADLGRHCDGPSICAMYLLRDTCFLFRFELHQKMSHQKDILLQKISVLVQSNLAKILQQCNCRISHHVALFLVWFEHVQESTRWLFYQFTLHNIMRHYPSRSLSLVSVWHRVYFLLSGISTKYIERILREKRYQPPRIRIVL